jgi:SAM-dependent methyltransferase
MFHVMEHIPDPVKTFKKLYDLLNEDGSLFIEVPNIESFSQSPDNTFFKAHIHYFSATTLIACASQYFDSVDLDNSDNNIRILFSRRSSIKELELPTKIDIEASKTILTQKGWFNYVFKGKGYQKVFNRLKVVIQDSRLVKMKPKAVLDAIISNK